MTAWLSRMLGRKTYYLMCVVLFTVSSLFCGLAPSLGFMLCCRIMQGVGGGGLAPVAQAILDSGTLTPLLKRLEKMGFVSRHRDPADERGIIVTLTREGEHLKTTARSVPGIIACAVGVSEENFAALHKSVVKAREHIRTYRRSMKPNLLRSAATEK